MPGRQWGWPGAEEGLRFFTAGALRMPLELQTLNLQVAGSNPVRSNIDGAVAQW